MNAEDVISTLGLEPHPEGGHYRETYADPAGSAIYFLLTAGQESAWHRVHDRAEIWHFYAGAPLEVRIREKGTVSSVWLGADLDAGQRPQAIVPPSAWQSARALGPWTLVGCTVSPAFTFDAFELEADG